MQIVDQETANRIQVATVSEVEEAIIDIMNAININGNSENIINRLGELELIPQSYNICEVTEPDDFPSV